MLLYSKLITKYQKNDGFLSGRILLDNIPGCNILLQLN